MRTAEYIDAKFDAWWEAHHADKSPFLRVVAKEAWLRGALVATEIDREKMIDARNAMKRRAGL